MVLLAFKDRLFCEADETSDSDIILDIKEEANQIIMRVKNDCGFVIRRTAERQIRGIQKSGFLTSDNQRIGEGYELVIEGEGGDVPDRLTHSPRQVY